MSWSITNLPPLAGAPEQVDRGTAVRQHALGQLESWFTQRASYGTDYAAEIERIRPIMYTAIVRETSAEVWLLHQHSDGIQATVWDLMTDPERDRLDAIRRELHGDTVEAQTAKQRAAVRAAVRNVRA